jgi:hypothetical protein
LTSSEKDLKDILDGAIQTTKRNLSVLDWADPLVPQPLYPMFVKALGLYDIVEELGTKHYPNGDAGAITANDTIEMVMRGEKNITVFPNTRAYTVHKVGNMVTSVDCFNTHTHRETGFKAPLFVDATGDGWIGYWAGCEVKMGRESRDEFNESLAPERSDDMTMGNTILWNFLVVETTSDTYQEKPKSVGFQEVP